MKHQPAAQPSEHQFGDQAGLRVLELYKAFQGEGTLTGTPSIFLRTAGCSVGCHWCDTKYSWKFAGGHTYSIEDLVSAVCAFNIGHLVITGGEPFEQPHEYLEEFVTELQTDYIHHITFETSGNFSTIDFGGLSTNILLSVAPKLPSAKTHYDFPDLEPFHYQQELYPHVSLQIKFVLDPLGDGVQYRSDLDFLENFFSTTLGSKLREYVPIILQPVSPVSKDVGAVQAGIISGMLALYDAVTKKGWDTWVTHLRVQPQLHAILYGSKRGI